MPSRLLLRSTLLLLILIWGTTWAAIRIALEGIPPLTGVALRFGIAALVLLALMPVLGVRFHWSRREVGLWLVNGLLSFTLSYSIVYWAEQYVPSGLTAVLFATFPLFTAALAHLVLPGERLSVAQSAGGLVGFGGVAVIFSEDLSRVALEGGGAAGPGVAVAAAVLLISPFVSAVANVAVKRWGKGIHPLSLITVPMAMTAVLVGAVAWKVEGFDAVHLTAASVGATVYLAVLGSAVTFSLYFWLLSYLPATRLSLITYAIPVVAVVTGTLALGEPITWRVLLGAALVVAGVAMAVRAGGGERVEEGA